MVAVSFILAFMTAKLVERPIRFGGLRRVGVRASTASMLLVAAMSLLIWRSGGALWRYPSEIRPLLETMNYNPRDDARMDCWLDNKAGFDAYAASCKTGTTVIWGIPTRPGFTQAFGKTAGTYLNSLATGACR